MKIFVVYHKPAKLIKSKIFVPIHVGRSVGENDSKDGKIDGKYLNWLHKNMQGDNTGDNISNANRNYCELTALYWIWKNCKVKENDYVGLMHYRRVFDFGNDSAARYRPRNKKVISCVKNFDIILPQAKKCWSPNLKTNAKNVAEHFRAEHGAIYTKILEEVLQEDPRFKESANNVLYESDSISWYNIFIAKKEILNDYCAWLFDTLEKLNRRCLKFISSTELETSRMMGFYGEILLNVYFNKIISEKKYEVNYLKDIKLEEDSPENITDNSIKGKIKRFIKGTKHAEDIKNRYIFFKFLRQKRKKEKFDGATAHCVHSLTYRNYFPNGGAGGGGAVLSCQKILLGNNFLGRQLKYSFFTENRYSDRNNCKELWDLWGAVQFVFDKTKNESNTVYITHDYATAFGLYLLGKRYVLVSHIQGSRVQEKINFNEKFSKTSARIIKYCEKKAMENAFYMCFPSHGSYSYFADSKYCRADVKNIKLGPVLYNTLYAFPKPEACPKIKEDKSFLTFFSSGQATVAKGIDQTLNLIEAIVKSTSKKIRWIYVGVGPLLPTIIGRCAKLMKENKNFVFSHMGTCTYGQAANLYRISDYYVMLHRISIFDLCTLEAMYHCKAIILSDVGGNPEFNIDENILFFNGNYEQTAQKILKADFKKLGGKNKKVFNSIFGQENFIARYKTLILNLINGNENYTEFMPAPFSQVGRTEQSNPEPWSGETLSPNAVKDSNKNKLLTTDSNRDKLSVASDTAEASNLFDSVNSLWGFYGASDNIVQLAKQCFDEKKISQEDHRTWLIFLSSLIERGELKIAKKILYAYIKEYNDWDIYRYLLVAEFACANSILVDEKIQKSDILLKHLRESQNNKVFRNLVQGKKVAIVGNGPSETGRKLGKIIDKHDIVIRFNNYDIQGHEIDYGTRTDIWVRGSGASDVINRENVEEYRLIVMEADYLHYPVIPNGHPDVLVKYIQEGKTLTNFDYDVHYSLRKESEIDFPTSGLVTVWYIYNLYKQKIVKDFNIYGFAFRQDVQDDIAHHYFNDRSMETAIERSKVHNLSKESSFILKLLANK